MKIAVISDIHGNLQALEAVMKSIKNNKCDTIFCLGDLAMAGPQPEETIDYIISLAKFESFYIIQGNTDYYIANFTTKLKNSIAEKFPIMANALTNDVDCLHTTQKEYLRNFPPQMELEIEKVKILLVHGSPRKNNEDILPDTPISQVDEMIQGVDANLILCGHTHIPCGFQTKNKKTIVNVGSVGRPFTSSPDACYAIIDVKGNSFTVSHEFVKYDNLKASNILKSRKFDGADKLAQILITPETRHI